jgi:hypothetical protein
MLGTPWMNKYYVVRPQGYVRFVIIPKHGRMTTDLRKHSSVDGKSALM